MPTSACDQCDFTATHEKQGTANFMMTRHKQAKHGLAIGFRSNKYVHKRKPKAEAIDGKSPKQKPTTQTSLCYCPHCGLNLSRVAAALVVAERMG